MRGLLGYLCLVACACASETALQPLTDGTVILADDLGPNEVEDHFVASRTTKPIDVLFVIDHSRSMRGEQQHLADNFGPFLDILLTSGVDFHVGVISMDVSDPEHSGRLQGEEKTGRRWIDVNTRGAAGLFSQMATLGTRGSSVERGRDAVFAAIAHEADDYNQGFFRPDAALHVVVVSDEDDQSQIDIPTFVDVLRTFRPDPTSLSWTSIVGFSNQPRGKGRCRARAGDAHLELTDRIGGYAYEICYDDWGTLLVNISRLILESTTEFFLTRPAIAETVQVVAELDGDQVNFEGPFRGWKYDKRRNSVTFFGFTPPPTLEVRVRYELAAPDPNSTVQ
ncbi:MAG: vWA domain-containing protein [Myxococcota bacterium]